MANLDGFDATQHEDPVSFDPIPANDYLVMPIASEFKNNKKGTGTYLEFTLEVIDGQFKGRRLWDRFNWTHPKEQAVQIGQKEFAALCKCVDILRPKDTSELHGVPVVAKVIVEPRSDNGELTNTIKAYSPANGTSKQQQATAPTTTTVAKPPWAK